MIRGAVPDPKQPLPPPSTPAYYDRGGQFVSADTTYLQQDFSVVQPVVDPGNWSSHQRYDYFVSFRQVDSPPTEGQTPDSPYRNAIGFALRELSGRDPDRDADWLAAQHRSAVQSPDTRLAAVAQLVSLQANPNALIHLKQLEFSIPFLGIPSADLGTFVKGFQRDYGPTAARTALIAYLSGHIRIGEDEAKAKAVRFLAVLVSDAPDDSLPTVLPSAGGLALPAPLPVPASGTVLGAPKLDSAFTSARKDAYGFSAYTLTKRIRKRSSAEIEKDLLAVKEVSLNGSSGKGVVDLITLAKAKVDRMQPYPGAAVASEGRPDLAGMPFRLGLDASLGREKANAMNALSKQLRGTIQGSITNFDDPRPDPKRLHAILTGTDLRGFGFHGDKKWATAEAVPCIQQMLQAEDRGIRRMSCELLSQMEVPEATEALVQWAVFDTDADNRAAAVAALKLRDRREVSRSLVRLIRYPWPRAAEHAAEALVALDLKEAIPDLVALYGQPDPDAPFRIDLNAIRLAGPKVDALLPDLAAPAGPAPMRPLPITTKLETEGAVQAAFTVAEGAAKSRRARFLERLEQVVVWARDQDEEVRGLAAVELVQCLKDREPSVRLKAAQVLGELGIEAAGAVVALTETTLDSDEGVRKAARRSLDTVNSSLVKQKSERVRAALVPLVAELKAKEPEDRIKALDKIAAFGRDANVAGEHVIEAMQDKVGAVQNAAAVTLGKLNPEVSSHVIAVLRGPRRREAILALGELGDSATITLPLLLRCNDDVFFWGGGNPKTGKYFEDLFPVVAKIAPKDKRFADSVLSYVATPNPKRERMLRDRRLAGIAQLDTIEATTAEKVKSLVAALGDSELTVEVIQKLEEYGKQSADALPALKKLKTSPIETIRNAAIKAIAKIE